jgi:diaminopimelate epimerase
MIKFAKMQGVGNDFVVVDARQMAGRDLPGLALAICERRFGVGADGLLVIGGASNIADLSFQMFNPDGSEDMCGNGLRCALLWAHRQGLIECGATVSVQGFDRVRLCRLLQVSPDKRRAVVTVDMGAPDFTPDHIPFRDSPNDQPGQPVTLTSAGRSVVLTPVSTGSAHSVVFLDEELSEAEFQQLSPLIETHPQFPERTSIMWTVPKPNGRYQVRIWERAAGETLGCGTGAAAIAAVVWAQNRTPANQAVVVQSRGGELSFEQDAAGSIAMTGPAEWIFEGMFFEGPNFIVNLRH